MSGDRAKDQPQQRLDPLVALDYIDTYQRSHASRSPSLWGMSSHFQIKTRLVIYGTLHQLASDNLLEIVTHGHGKPADTVITEAGRQRLREWRSRQSQPADQPGGDER